MMVLFNNIGLVKSTVINNIDYRLYGVFTNGVMEKGFIVIFDRIARKFITITNSEDYIEARQIYFNGINIFNNG